MSPCEELNNLYREAKEKIEALKTELDLEFQKEKGERDYSEVQDMKKKIEKEVEELKDELNPIPEPLRGKEGVRIEILEIGGKTKEQLIQEIKEKKIKITEYPMEILDSSDFTTSTNVESLKLIHLKVQDLGFPEDEEPTTDEIYERIKKIGLELCPPEVGPNYRLKNASHPVGESIWIGMKPIRTRYSFPRVLGVEWNNRDLWLLSSHLAEPTREWDPGDEFVFCIRPFLRKTEKSENK